MLVLSCNVAGGLKDRWSASLDVLQKSGADLIGLQELNPPQKTFYLAGMPDYDAFGTLDRPDIKRGIPTDGILYRRDKFEVLSSGAHWLSETPHICGSRSWGSNCIRLLNWMVLEERSSGLPFLFYNTHLDHYSQLAREQQARMINESAQAYPADLPQILTGDMNAGITNAAINVFISGGWRDTYQEAHGKAYEGISWHGLEGDVCQRAQDVPGNEKGAGRIDWIFIRGSAIAQNAYIIKDRDAKGNLPSDHYFFAAEIELKPKSNG